jgi:hypothetical protein
VRTLPVPISGVERGVLAKGFTWCPFFWWIARSSKLLVGAFDKEHTSRSCLLLQQHHQI